MFIIYKYWKPDNKLNIYVFYNILGKETEVQNEGGRWKMDKQGPIGPWNKRWFLEGNRKVF